MLELKLVKESIFLNVLEAIIDLVDVANVDCSSTGLKLQAVDTEHVVIITLFFPADHFEDCKCDEHLSIGIPIDNMIKAIRCADKSDTITMSIDDDNYDTITLSFKSPKEKKATTAYDLLLVGAKSQRFRIPDWQDLDSKYQAFVQMSSVEFLRVCKYLTNIGGDGDISVTDKGLKFFASGTIGRVNIKPEDTDTFVTMRAPVSMTLDLKYMNSLAKVSILFNQVKIGLSTMQPLMAECKIGEKGYIRCFVAPKVKPEIEEEITKSTTSEG